MTAAEIKLDLFRKIDNLNDPELEKIYNPFVVLLNASSDYTLSNDEKTAIDEALEAGKRGKSYGNEEVMEGARRKYPNLKFK